jgi:hypothetical protein
MPPRMTEKSCRPRVSDRTMVGNSATRLACEFQRTEGRRRDNDMKPQRGSSIAGPSLRGLWGRSATGQNGQVPKEKTRQYGGGLDAAKILLASASGRSVFRLTSLFIGLIDRLAGHFLGCEPSPSFASSATLPSALSELRQSFYGRLGTLCVLCGH